MAALDDLVSLLQWFSFLRRFRPGDGWVRLVRVSPHFGGSGVFTALNDFLFWDRNWYTASLEGPAFTELMNWRQKFQHDKDDDAFGLVWRTRHGHLMLDYSGADTDPHIWLVFRNSA